MLLKLTDNGYISLKLHVVSDCLNRYGFRRLALLNCFINRWVTSVEIRPSATLGKNLKMPHPNGIVIGDCVRIGNSVTILQQVTIGAVRIKSSYTTLDVPNVCDGVLLGAGSKILGGITIGASAIVGANAVVLTDVPANSTAIGIPARILPPKRDR